MFNWCGRNNASKPNHQDSPFSSSYSREGGVRRSLTHASEIGEVLFGGLVLLVLINPLVEVRLEEVDLLGFLEQAWPVGIVELLLAKLQLDIARAVVDLALSRINLGVELELEVVRLFEGVRVAGECQAGGPKVQLEVAGRHIGNANGQIDEVLLGVGLGGALRPENCSKKKMVRSVL